MTFGANAKGPFGAIFADVFKSNPSAEQIEAALDKASAQINKAVPVTLDQDTLLSTTYAGPGPRFTYVYKLNASSETIKNVDFFGKQRPRLVQAVCSTIDTRKLVDLGVTFVYWYRAEDWSTAGKIDVSPADCKAVTRPRP